MCDSDVARLCSLLPTDPRLVAAVVGEAFVRCWLYGDRCPAPLSAITRRLAYRRVGQAFRELAVPSRDGSAPKIGTVAQALDRTFGAESDSWVWEHIHSRLVDFLECDGLLPLVAGAGDGDAVAVPFRLLPGKQHAGEALDRSGRKLTLWSKLVTRLDRDLGGSHAVRILADFVDGLDEPEGRSLGLALVVARSRRAGALLLSPLKVLASGAIWYGRLQEIDGLQAKRALSKRLGCTLFIAPGFFEDKFILSLTPRQSIKDLARCLRRELAILGPWRDARVHRQGAGRRSKRRTMEGLRGA